VGKNATIDLDGRVTSYLDVAPERPDHAGGAAMEGGV
jgi:hypothetical protein